MEDLEKATYPPVGKCIYCGSNKDLRREHIIPYALGSNTFLPKATCPNCARITGCFEQEVLRGSMWAVRVIRNLKSRTKHKDAPKTKLLTLTKEGRDQRVELPLDEYPVLLSFPVFTLPGYLDPGGYTQGIRITGNVTIRFGSPPETILTRFGATGLKITQNDKPTSFARMIAKIAYSMAYAKGALETIKGNPTVISSILGVRDDIGLWVGTLQAPHKAQSGLLHRISLIEDRKLGLLLSEVQLFADSQTPNYIVILGHL